MICFLHGYLLEGSGSNLWTRSIIEALCRQGHDVHLMAQENHPDLYPFISEARIYRRSGEVELIHEAETETEGHCILHRPELGDLLPVYVRDRYEEFSRVVPMVELGDDEIEAYLQRNVDVLRQIVSNHDITVLHANHAVLMSVVARRIHEEVGIPYVVMPHGSAIEYAVKPDERMKAYAEDAMREAEQIVVIGDEIRQRLKDSVPGVPDLTDKTFELHLGVDTGRFLPVGRGERHHSINDLKSTLRGLDRGKEPDQSEALIDTVGDDPSLAELKEAIEESSDYELKEPDADLEAKLDLIDWDAQKTVLYVGRLIANKGPQNILAALPWVIAREPDLSFVLVGHGPMRELLEAMIEAMSEGNEKLVRAMIEEGSRLDGEADPGESGVLTEWKRYLDELEQRGELADYFRAAREIDADRVIFTGYLTHRELRYLFPCFDVAVFPSLVREAGPLVFLEALSSGIFPMGTYFGGMKASIDSLADVMPEGDLDLMKIDPDPARLVRDIAAKLPRALQLADQWRDELRDAAVANYDWKNVAASLEQSLSHHSS